MGMTGAIAGASLAIVVLGATAGLGTGCGSWVDEATCADDACEWSRDEWSRLSSLTGLGEPPADPTNRYSRNPAAAELGRLLFYDSSFSGPSRQRDALERPAPYGRAPAGQPTGVSCATCHSLRAAGADRTSVSGHVSVGAGVTDVNALPIVNAAHQAIWFWNGRVDSLWALNVVVAESPTTMNGNRLRIAQALSLYPFEATAVFQGDPNWLKLPLGLPSDGKPGSKDGCQAGDPEEPFGDAFDCLPADTAEIVTKRLVLWAKAIAAFEHQIYDGNSEFDRFIDEGPRSPAISPRSKRGARLFVGKAGCIDCHAGPLLADGDFHNVGVPQTGPAVPTLADCPDGGYCDCVNGTRCLPWGAHHGLRWLRDERRYPWSRNSKHSDDRDDGSRRTYHLRQVDEALKGAWRTPSLRNVALTAPYMHNGAFATLDQVVRHYNNGGRGVAGAVGRPDVRLKPLGLTEDEAADLVAFLQTLTGQPTDAARSAP